MVMAREKPAVLYTRAEPALVAALDREVEVRRAKTRGVAVSRSDVIRSILWEALPQPGDVADAPVPEAMVCAVHGRPCGGTGSECRRTWPAPEAKS